jgi:dual adaptor for phosphotyrosine/3-phosphotyrosine/3-phosphoinositide
MMSAIQPQSIEDLEWFHPNADRHVAESLLMQNGREGSYLLRPSTKKNMFTLSVRAQESVKHFPVTADGSSIFKFGMAVFHSLAEFIEHFNSQPVVAGESGVVTLLSYPYPRDVCEPGLYEVVKVHAQIGRPVVSSDSPSLSLGSKEGFLTKRGGMIKSWKLRWFVLKKFELGYYAQRGDVTPIRKLDLRECTLCGQDTSQGHDFCFRLDFPWRTFFLRAATAEDAQEWINLIRWKLQTLHANAQ